MEDMSVGARIKYYRNLLDISQRELGDNTITSNLVSLLESNRRRLTIPTAGILVEKFNRIAGERGVRINLTLEELVMSEEVYARKCCNARLKNLRGYDKRDYVGLLEICERYGVSDMAAELAEKIGDEEFDSGNHGEALVYLEKALKHNMDLKTKYRAMEILKSMGICHYKLGEMKRAIKCYEEGLGIYREIQLQDYINLKKLSFNLALCYKRLGDYDRALELLEEAAEAREKAGVRSDDIDILEANIYLLRTDYEKSLEINLKLLEKGDCDSLELVYSNIGVTLSEMNRFDESIRYLNEALKLKGRERSPLITRTIMELGDVSFKREQYRESALYYENALRNALIFNQFDDKVRCYRHLYRIFKKLNTLSKFEPYEEDLRRILEKEKLEEQFFKLGISILEKYYEDTDNGPMMEHIAKIKRERVYDNEED